MSNIDIESIITNFANEICNILKITCPKISSLKLKNMFAAYEPYEHTLY